MRRGYIKLWRKIQDSPFWFRNRVGAAREASEMEAWQDLLLSANHSPGQVLVKGKPIPVGRGQLVASVRYLAERWQWSRSKTQRFIQVLKYRNDIGTVIVQGMEQITITNYGLYNDVRDTAEPQDGTLAGHSRDTDGTLAGQTEEVKGVKNGRMEEGGEPPARSRAPLRGAPGPERAELEMLVKQFKEAVTYTKPIEWAYRDMRAVLEAFPSDRISEAISRAQMGHEVEDIAKELKGVTVNFIKKDGKHPDDDIPKDSPFHPLNRFVQGDSRR